MNVPKDFFGYVQHGTHQGELMRQMQEIKDHEDGGEHSSEGPSWCNQCQQLRKFVEDLYRSLTGVRQN